MSEKNEIAELFSGLNVLNKNYVIAVANALRFSQQRKLDINAKKNWLVIMDEVKVLQGNEGRRTEWNG